MRARRELPANYVATGEFNLEDTRLLTALNLIGLGLLVGAAWFFAFVFYRLRPQEGEISLVFRADTALEIGVTLLTLLGLVVIMVVVHEALHGLGFWWFTRELPKFRFKVWYASASAPGWYFRLPDYLIIGLLPFIGISLLGILLVPWVPSGWLVPLWALLTMNASGAVGDLAVVVWLLRFPRTAWVQDFHTRMVVYLSPTDFRHADG